MQYKNIFKSSVQLETFPQKYIYIYICLDMSDPALGQKLMWKKAGREAGVWDPHVDTLLGTSHIPVLKALLQMSFLFPNLGYGLVSWKGNRIFPDVWTDLNKIESLTSEDEVEDPWELCFGRVGWRFDLAAKWHEGCKTSGTCLVAHVKSCCLKESCWLSQVFVSA